MPHTPAPDTLRGTYWNKRYREEGAIWGDRPSPTAEWAQRHFRERGCDSLLVAGCGYGRNLSCFAGQGYTRLLGLDLSSEAVEMARRNFPELDLRCGDLLELAPEPAPFSALYAFNLLHFFLAEGRRNFADAARRLLAPGGLLALSVFSHEDPASSIGREVEPGSRESKPGRPAHYFHHGELARLFRGFELLEEIGHVEAESHGAEGPHRHHLLLALLRRLS